MLPSEIVAPLCAEERKMERRGRHLVVVNESSAHAVEKIEKKFREWVFIFYP